MAGYLPSTDPQVPATAPATLAPAPEPAFA
jgi:hypothetical protein